MERLSQDNFFSHMLRILFDLQAGEGSCLDNT